MKNNVLLLGALALGLGWQIPASAQKDASSAEEVLGPVDAKVPLERNPPAPAAARPAPPPPPMTSPPASPPPVATQPAEAPAVAEEEIPVADSERDYRRHAHHGVGVALRLSILQGLGVEGIYGLSDYFNVRGQFNYLSVNRNFNEDGVDYDAHVKLQSFGALIDYHPFAGSFRLSAGLYNDGNEITSNATCRSGSQCNVGDDQITSTSATDNPSIHAGLDMKKGVVPYLGFGWGNAMTGSPLHFAFDIGVMFQGSVPVTLSASGQGTVCDTTKPAGPGSCAPGQQRTNVNLATDPQVQAQVAQEQSDLQEKVNDYKLWPAISFTIGYRFGS